MVRIAAYPNCNIWQSSATKTCAKKWETERSHQGTLCLSADWERPKIGESDICFLEEIVKGLARKSDNVEAFVCRRELMGDAPLDETVQAGTVDVAITEIGGLAL